MATPQTTIIEAASAADAAEKLNPLTDLPLRPEAAEQVLKLQLVRRNARKYARSGNPANRYPAMRARAIAADLIRKVYRREAGR